MNKLQFKEEGHEYLKNNENYTSVTTLIGNYKPKFDKDHWSKFKALTAILGTKHFFTHARGRSIKDPAVLADIATLVDPISLENEQKKVLAGWQKELTKAVKKGTKYHNSRENLSYSRGYEINPFTGEQVPTIKVDTMLTPQKDGIKESISNNLYDLEPGYYPELLLWNDKYKLAGTADKVFIYMDGNNKCIDIDDYKTNKKIYTSSRYGNMMLNPIAHLEDCNLIHYNLQISLYAWMMEQFGFKVKNLAFHHYNKRYDLEYLNNEIELILKTYNNEQK